jgi:hypothetical protein
VIDPADLHDDDPGLAPWPAILAGALEEAEAWETTINDVRALLKSSAEPATILNWIRAAVDNQQDGEE